MTNASIYIGSNSTSVQANALVAVSGWQKSYAHLAVDRPPCAAKLSALPPRPPSGAGDECAQRPTLPLSLFMPPPFRLQEGIDIPPRGTVAVPAAGAVGRYVIVWTGMLSEVSDNEE